MTKPTALLIEDDRDIAALFRHVLDISGFRTEIVMDGKDAITRLSTVQPDIVLLDLQLPNLSGVDILKQMRQVEAMNSIPVVVVTAFAYLADDLPVEPELILTKPVDINELTSLIKRIYTTKDTLQEPSHDMVTGLYTESFFTMRLVFALERVKQLRMTHFGVLLADLDTFTQLGEQLGEEKLNAFKRGLASQFKSALRPTDTIAWSNEGYFLTLIEQIARDDVPLMVAKRIEDKLSSFLQQHEDWSRLQVKTRVVLCDFSYESAQEILDDVSFARTLAKNETEIGPQLCDREGLQSLRDSQAI
jgi:two-component system, cell cycle response regulator DivK